MSEEHPESVSTDEQTAGDLLRTAREKKDLDIKDVAHRLNLNQDIIIALETNDANLLPASTYVRGYLRSYAKLLGLDGDYVVQVYDSDREPTEKPQEIIAEVNKPEQIRSKDLPVKAFTYLITFVFALLLLAWLQSHTVMNKADERNFKQSEPAPAPEPEGQTVISDDGHVVHYYPAFETWVKETENAGEEKVISPEEMMIRTIDLPGSPLKRFSETDDSNLAMASDRLDRVEISLSQESWIEVYDANNERLYMGLARPGEVISLEGLAPLSLLLGYTPGVTINYNGREIEPDHYSSSGVSRLILGGNPETE